MRLPLFLLAIIVLIVVPVGSAGQQNPDAAHRAIAESPINAAAGKPACGDISAWINSVLRARSITEGSDGSVVPQEISLGNLRFRDLDCGAVPALAPGSRLELMKVFFERTLHSWEFMVRCGHISDCVPFLVRWPRPAGDDPIKHNRVIPGRAVLSASRINPQPGTHFLLRRGETVTLVWDQDGIRVVLPAICLEQGNAGESIRVRMKDGGRVFRAEILNAFLLRVVL